MNERVKQLRKELNLSGEKFGSKIGLKKVAISQIENGKTNLTESNIISICREFNVNEEWLRTGNGDMFTSLDELDLNSLASSLDPLELDILKAYFSLDKEIRQKAIKHFKDSLK